MTYPWCSKPTPNTGQGDGVLAHSWTTWWWASWAHLRAHRWLLWAWDGIKQADWIQNQAFCMAACMEALLRELFSPGCVCWGWLANPRPSAHPAEPYWYCHLAPPYVLWNLPQGWGLPVEMEGLQCGKAPWGEGEEGPQQFFMTLGFCSVPWIIKNRPPPRLHLQSEMYCVWILELAPEGQGGSMVLWDISASCRVFQRLCEEMRPPQAALEEMTS